MIIKAKGGLTNNWSRRSALVLEKDESIGWRRTAQL